MKIKTLVLGQLQTNCYLVWDEKSTETIIIDPADEGSYIGQKIIDLKLKPKFIVATHGHFDHILGATELALAFNLPFLMNDQDEFLLQKNQASVKYFLGFNADPPPKISKTLKEGNFLVIGRDKLEVIETPGHTPGSICLYSKGVLFSGDTLFKNGIGRTDFSYSSHADLLSSIKEKLLILPPETLIYPGHGEETTVNDEQENFND